VKLLQLLRGIDAKLVREDRAGPFERAEGIGLAVHAVQREHQLAPQPLAQGILTREPLQLRHGLDMATEVELDGDLLLCCLELELLQPGDLGRKGRLVRQVGERRPPPQIERFRECRRGGTWLAVGSTRLMQQSFEAERVDIIGFGAEQVPGGVALDRTRAEHGPEARDVRLKGPACGVGGVVSPQRVDQPLGGNHLVRVQDQVSEDGPLLRTAEREGAFVP
jgi:hypothetical protein